MTKQELLEKLEELHDGWDHEANHSIADKLLLEFINDPEVTEAFDKIEKWYA